MPLGIYKLTGLVPIVRTVCLIGQNAPCGSLCGEQHRGVLPPFDPWGILLFLGPCARVELRTGDPAGDRTFSRKWRSAELGGCGKPLPIDVPSVECDDVVSPEVAPLSLRPYIPIAPTRPPSGETHRGVPWEPFTPARTTGLHLSLMR